MYKLKWDNVDIDSLKMALKATSSNRNTAHILKQYNDVIRTIEISDEMKKHWIAYQNQFDYAKEISFEEICIVLKEVLYKINRR